jgi:hypothetical protein
MEGSGVASFMLSPSCHHLVAEATASANVGYHQSPRAGAADDVIKGAAPEKGK